MENLRGAALMTLSMLGFAIEDAFIKSLAGAIPPGQIISVIGAGGALAFALWLRLSGRPVLVREHLHPRVLARSGCEIIGTMFFVSSLALIDLTLASAIIQATPLVVALGAVAFLGQTVGWRRWVAILVGFGGVMVILRPGGESSEPLALLAVGGMIFLAARDLVTRALNLPISGVHLSLHAFAALVPAGAALCYAQGDRFVLPSGPDMALLGACIAIGVLAYLAIVAATRAGDAAIISSFRYSRMVFALGIGWFAFAETPDTATLLGITIVIGAGLFTLLREARMRRTSQASPDAL